MPFVLFILFIIDSAKQKESNTLNCTMLPFSHIIFCFYKGKHSDFLLVPFLIILIILNILINPYHFNRIVIFIIILGFFRQYYFRI